MAKLASIAEGASIPVLMADRAKPALTSHSRPALDAKALWTLVGIFAFALAARLVALMEVASSPFASLATVPLGDGRQYWSWAGEIAAGEWWGDEVFYQAPLYPYFLAVLRTAGASVLAVKGVQVVLGAVTCVLLALAGRRLVSPPVGVVAGLLLAVYPPAIFFDLLLQKTSLALLFMTSILVLVAALLDAVRPFRLLALGLALGALILLRENALVLVPVLVVWVALLPCGGADAAHERTGEPALVSPDTGRRLARSGLVLVALGAVLGPVALRNFVVGGELALTTSQLGPNFYIGNHAGASGRYQPLVPGRQDARVERTDAVALAEAASGRSLGPGEVSRYWLGRALEDVRSNPLDWLRLLLRKSVLALSARELVDTESLEAYRDVSSLLRGMAWLHFGVLGPLTVLGMWATRSEWRRLSVLYALAAALLASLVVFYVAARYRFPVVPIVVLFGAAGLVFLYASIRARLRGPAAGRGEVGPGGWRGALLASALVVAVAVVMNWPAGVSTAPQATTYFNLGTALFELGDDAGARQALERARDLLADSAPVRVALARVLAAGDELDAARGELEAALTLDPGLAEAHVQLGYVLSRSGDLESAAAHLERALTLDPGDALAANLYGNVRAQQGRREEAEAAYERALELDPSLVDARFKLARLLVEEGRDDEGRAHLLEVVRLQPELGDAHTLLGMLFERSGDDVSAAASYRRAVTSNRDDVVTAARLAWLLATSADDAVRRGAEALTLAADLEQRSGGRDATVADVLAAAAAEHGDFDEAARQARRALERARAAGRLDLLPGIEARLRRYEDGQPYRKPRGSLLGDDSRVPR